MSAVAVAISAGVVGIGSAIIGANAAQGAANTEANAANSANQTQWNEYQTTLANEAPYLQAGNSALSTLNSEMPSLTAPFTTSDFHESPGYEFQLNQGLQAMQRSAAAKGLLSSVGTQQNLNNYAQGTANTDYQTALSNYMNSNSQRYNMLSGLVNVGQNAAGMNANAGANYANASSANTMGAANAQAAGTIGTANSITGALSSGANTFSQANLLNSLLNMKNGGANAGSVGGMTMPGGFMSGGYGSGGAGGASPLGLGGESGNYFGIISE